MEFVIREKKPNETLWKVKYYDCDLHTSENLSSFSFESAEVAEAYGKVYYAYENTGNTSYQGVVEVKEEENVGFMTSDANHWGVVFYSKNKERLQQFSQLLEEEGAAMTSITPAFNTRLVVCDIDKEWKGVENINPFYYWYYGADSNTEENKEDVTVDFGDYEEPEEPEDDEFWNKKEQEWKDEEECRADIIWEEMEDSMLGRRRRL